METRRDVTTPTFAAANSASKMETVAVSPKEQTRKRNSFPVPYIAVIAHAILSSPQKKLPLSDIYKFIEQNYPGFTENRKRWKNTVRHNLSLHDCFLRGEVALNKKGCNWRIHPSFQEEFSRGDFSRRRFSQINLWDQHEPQRTPCSFPFPSCQICSLTPQGGYRSLGIHSHRDSASYVRYWPFLWNPNTY